MDNTAIQDGFQLYLHNFILSDTGEWTVIQQGMRDDTGTARRYHWHSESITSFVEEPHTAICGTNQGEILNMVAHQAIPSQQGILKIASENPDRMINEIQQLILPHHHDVRSTDVDLRRLGSMLWLAHDSGISNFEDLLMLQGLGPRTLQSLALVSEVIHGTPSRFKDPARFSFAHGGKDGHPFPVPTKVYDETIQTLTTAVEKAKMGNADKQEALKSLSVISERLEKDFTPTKQVEEFIEQERRDSWKYGGRTVFGDSKPPEGSGEKDRRKGVQLRLF